MARAYDMSLQEMGSNGRDSGSRVFSERHGSPLLVSEVTERDLFLPGEDAVVQGVLDALGPTGGDVCGDLVLGGAGPGRDGP